LKKKSLLTITFITLLFLGIKIFLANKTPYEYSKSIQTLGTHVTITLYAPKAKELTEETFDYIEKFSQQLNIYNPKSEVSLINTMAGLAAAEVSDDTYEIIEKSINISKNLDSYFDISAGPLIDIWNEAKETKTLPLKSKIWATQTLVDFRQILLNPQKKSVKLLKPYMRLNLGGVAKGFVLGKARDFLLNKGVQNALISSNSSIVTLGEKQPGRPWKIGIKDPREKDKLIGFLILSGNYSISTSGDYEQNYIINGKQYTHIINPKTGYPAEGLKSVTLITKDSTKADILSTTIFTMGPRKGFSFLKNSKDVEGLIVTSRGKIVVTDGFKYEKGKK